MPLSHATIKTRHFTVQNQQDNLGINLSVYKITFEDSEAAKKVFSEVAKHPTGTVADNKVLTKYAAKLEEQDVYVIRTQSIMEQTVTDFMSKFVERKE